MRMSPRSAGGIALCACLPALGLAACDIAGDGDADQSGSAATINVTAAITDSRIDVSPQRLGAGPIVLVISNRSSGAQEVTFETGGDDGLRMRQTTSAINPRGTAHLPVDLRQGTYELSVGDTEIRPAVLTVGRAR
jgi:hypothetical protein